MLGSWVCLPPGEPPTSSSHSKMSDDVAADAPRGGKRPRVSGGEPGSEAGSGDDRAGTATVPATPRTPPISAVAEARARATIAQAAQPEVTVTWLLKVTNALACELIRSGTGFRVGKECVFGIAPSSVSGSTLRLHGSAEEVRKGTTLVTEFLAGHAGDSARPSPSGQAAASADPQMSTDEYLHSIFADVEAFEVNMTELEEGLPADTPSGDPVVSSGTDS